MSDNPELISQFTAITGVDEDRAKFYLESSAWKLDVAISRYYENDGGEISEDNTPDQPSESEQSHQAAPPRPKSKTTNSNFATLNTLTTSSDEEEEEGQAFYAGGSEHSGQQVLGPSKKKDIVSGMFKSVQKHGVEIVDQKPGGSKLFKGKGYKLGQTADDSEEVEGAAGPAPSPEVTLKLWKDGFTVNEGELRAYTDPANTEFLQSIQRGEIPQELRQGNTEVYLAMEDHRMESFKQVDKGVKPFTGQGYTLGSPAPPVVGAQREEDKPANEERAKQALKLDSSQPTTNIQIRLSDGSRLVAQFNHTHTVGDVRQYILTARPQYQTRNFNLLSGYPSRILEDSQSLAEGNLLNSAIMQKLI
ncbi:NSFL1 cofactor p47 [Tribolium castaneum]|uniref:NSFL1 cofactor p47-like Protein n=1 Tax=Tribolium castaneum TaxID=7070 RepID=D6WT40_TRICA|nr:PREDICTED: NSFL1 cofactor p47 [Tribolium castaneum]XP_008196358.1 PREDICTED: NSFL1 cofactor p47 [Tribolium castaneum]EFA05869.1 NSFL1 cofactor p47-like Protein [Tribolium castaneum]|eukprot:XP_008196357.1 PREDICTED: NSFL1 cofactor p47 [Tribolium castaneum]